MVAGKLEFSRGEIIASKYETIDLLDESPLGLTYRVKHLKSGKFVRLTMLRPKIANKQRKHEVLDAFKLARSFDHPNVMKVGELGEHNGVAYYTMEDMEGSSLRELLDEYRVEGKRFTVKEAAQITIQILEALESIHASGNVLRSIRPEYVVVHVRRTGPRQANIVAKAKVIGAGFWPLVPVGTLAEDEFTRGEAQYLAPELKSFEPTPSARCDVYSVGVILYEMLTGTAPVGTFQLPSTLRNDLPRHVDDIVELVLANAPEDRYQTARDFHTDIQRIFDDLDVIDEGPSRNLVPVILVALGVVLAVALAATLFLRPEDPLTAKRAMTSALRNEVAAEIEKPSQDEIMATLAQHPPNMVFIPKGPYINGKMHFDPDAGSSEATAAKVDVDAFLIDAFEYPNIYGQRPVMKVSYTKATELCELAGKRLCTHDEWEKACKGPLNYIYGYGDAFDPEFCGNGLESRGYSSGTMKKCKSEWGVYDIMGNYREWTGTAPKGKDNRHVVKGGLMGNPYKGSRCASSTDESDGYKDSSMSFRCCRDVDAPPIAKKAPDEGDDPEHAEAAKGGGGGNPQ